MLFQFNKLKRVRMYSVLRLYLASLFLALFAVAPGFSQNHLSRISIVDRSDGLGAVLRYHLVEAIDSFSVSQPAPDLIQMVLYHPDIDTTNILLPESDHNLNEIHLYNLEIGRASCRERV